ncbi:hypothetical protein ACFZDJ_37645 [Streptomyces sp. NPDC007896]|uniref:hypothetical protein n=1 Tax=Streptomyces sp. NPDC007896 TaxID=3364784 RepID=UPI0036EAD2B7
MDTNSCPVSPYAVESPAARNSRRYGGSPSGGWKEPVPLPVGRGTGRRVPARRGRVVVAARGRAFSTPSSDSSTASSIAGSTAGSRAAALLSGSSSSVGSTAGAGLGVRVAPATPSAAGSRPRSARAVAALPASRCRASSACGVIPGPVVGDAGCGAVTSVPVLATEAVSRPTAPRPWSPALPFPPDACRCLRTVSHSRHEDRRPAPIGSVRSGA